MATIPSIKVWTNGEVLTHTDLNNALATIRDNLVARGLFTDEARTVTAVVTFSAQPVFNGGVDINADSSVTGNLTVTGNVTASGNLSGTLTGSGAGLTNLPAAELTGTLPAISGANLTNLTGANVTGSLDVDAVTTDALTLASGRAVGHRIVSSGSSTTLNAANGNWFRHTLTGSGTITLSNLTAGQVILVEVLQNGTGGHAVTFSGVTSWDNGNVAPTFTTTANRKDLLAFVRAGADTLGVVLGQNYASTS